jgi:hypothetical protein
MPKSQHIAKKQHDVYERRRQVAHLRLAGVTDQKAIARQLGVSEPTISRDVKWLDEQNRQLAAEDTAVWRGLQLARIERLIQAVWSDAVQGRYGAIDRVVLLLERQAKLLGLDAPAKLRIDVIEEIRVIAGSMGYDPEQAVEAAQRILRNNGHGQAT